MKNLLIVLLALPVMAQAQLEVGADYGPNFYKISERYTGSRATYSFSGYTSGMFSEVTGTGSIFTLSYRFNKVLLAGIGFDSYVLPLSGIVPGDFYYSHPMTNLYVYAGSEHISGRITVSPQLMAGKSIVTGCDYTPTGTSTNGGGLLLEFRLSIDYNIWNGICLNLQGCGGAAFINLDMPDVSGYSNANGKETIALFHIAGGLHYRLAFKHASKGTAKTLK